MEKLAVAVPMFSKEPLRIGPALRAGAAKAKSINVDKAILVELCKALTKLFLFCICFLRHAFSVFNFWVLPTIAIHTLRVESVCTTKWVHSDK